MSRAALHKLRLPVMAAPMFLVSGPDMVIAAARSGIAGAFPTPNCRTADELDRWMEQIAQELGVRYVLEGSVRRAGDAVRINAQLVDASTGGHLWAERYDGTLDDIFDLQDSVAAQIVAALAVSRAGTRAAPPRAGT